MVQQVGGLRPTAPQPAASPDFATQIIGFILMAAILAIIIFAIILVVKWLFNKKLRNVDIYSADYKRTLELCKIHKNPKFVKSIMGLPQFIASVGVPVMVRYPSLDYSKQYVKSRPKKSESEEEKARRIRNTQLTEQANINARPGGTYKLGTYAGSCYTHDGCFNLMVKSSKFKVMGLFPKLLVLKLRLQHEQKMIDPEDRKKTKIVDVPPDSYSPSEDIIIIDCLGLEKINYYYYCVNMDKDGYIVDTRSYAYQDMIEISNQKQLLDMGRNMVGVAEELVRTNPLVQVARKTDSGLTND